MTKRNYLEIAGLLGGIKQLLPKQTVANSRQSAVTICVESILDAATKPFGGGERDVPAGSLF